jgi:signal transduction histidine kinase
VLRIAQEALSNIGKHARASRVTVTLSHMEDLVALDVQDDGDGFDPQRLPDGLLIESGPGEGTTLAVQLPLEAEQNATGSPESK